MGTEKNLTVLTTSSSVQIRTNPYKSVQIQSFGLTAPRGVQSTRFIGRLSLTRAACVLALSEQREAEKPDPEKAAQLRFACLPPNGKLTGWDIQTVPQAHFWDL